MSNFEEQVETHYKPLYYFALNLTRNPTDAEDLTQVAFLKLAKNINKIRDVSKTKSWLFSALYRHFIDMKRRSNKFPEVTFEEEVGPELKVEPATMDNQLDGHVVVQLLQEMPEALRVPLSLFYFEDHSYNEIAQVMSLPVGTVMSRLYRGKAELHKRLTAPETAQEEAKK